MELFLAWAEQFLEANMQQYLGLKHSYTDINCITLVKKIYLAELGIVIELPEYPQSQKWMRVFNVDAFDKSIEGIAQKIPLTAAKNFDLLVFKQRNTITHFGLFLSGNKMLHIESNSFSKIELLNSYWRDQLYAVYRHSSLV